MFELAAFLASFPNPMGFDLRRLSPALRSLPNPPILKTSTIGHRSLTLFTKQVLEFLYAFPHQKKCF